MKFEVAVRGEGKTVIEAHSAKEALDLHAQAIGFPGFAEQVQSIGEDAAEQGRFAKLFKVRRVK